MTMSCGSDVIAVLDHESLARESVRGERGTSSCRPEGIAAQARRRWGTVEGIRTRMIDPKRVEPYLDQALSAAAIAELPQRSQGKVRDSYDLPDGCRILIATDRLSAFDRILTT